MKATKIGTVTIKPDGWIEVGDDWEFDYTEDPHIPGCRAAALYACAWAIEQLARESGRTVALPGAGKIVV